MNRNCKKISVITVLVIFTIAFLHLPTTLPANTQVSLSGEAISFMTDVLDLDLRNYSIQVKVSNVDNNKLFDAIVKHNFISADSKVDVISLFRNNKVIWCMLYPIEGLPEFVQVSPAKSLDAAKGVLDKLEQYSSKIYLPTMRSMIDTVTDQINNSKVVDEIKQNISFTADSEIYQWSDNSNGIENSHKTLIITFRKGNFEFFCDNYEMYKIGNTNVEILQDQAVQIAKQNAIDKYTDSGNQTFPDFKILDKSAKISLSMQDRGNYTLYPLWDILLPLDEMYGAVSAIQVLVWADSGEIPFVAAVGNYGVVPSNQISSTVSTTLSESSSELYDSVLSVLIVAIVVVAGCLLYKRRR
jgi:hypothetical protein